MHGTVSVIGFREFLLGARALGVRGLRAAIGIEQRVLDDKDARVPFAMFDRAWREAAARGGPHFGLRIAALARLGTNEILDYLVNASATLGDALQRLQRYHRLMIDGFDIAPRRDRGRARVVANVPASAGVCPEMMEGLIAMLFLRGHQLVGKLPLDAVQFSHRAPADTAEHARLFGCPVAFDQPACALVFDAAYLDRAVATADPVLCGILDRQAAAALSQLPVTADGHAARVRAAIVAQLCGGDPGLAAIARGLRVHPRTLQRWLAAEGTSHEQILDRTRHELALHYLADRSRAVCEIAFLLGFSEPSAFHRAFRRWTGTTPLHHRRTRGDPGQGLSGHRDTVGR